ncbi:sushi, von Willebrand factor type A, EGF and pentraxin domain-containing protein 1-like [Mya arenaria]|uniref:sushi, von Willebrand factor type A, EGF and pentraxin domain-containing protein 1-like n=1 Tax=Mya arenaria TaxID=6604 RepID=UPI0022E13C9C|nr:sushi, von Willebrand factor type A, EGF and pentraxin domain-containing protein 1-like [Mya arenaria]
MSATTYMSVATYTCESGYNLNGNNTIHCMRNGKWSTVNASCYPGDCKAPPIILHGHVDSNASTYLSVATYTCDPGYNIVGKDTTQCLQNGTWSSIQASCNLLDCNVPSTIDHGNVTVQTTTYHSVASYTCDPGYNIIGNRTIQCMSSGNWSRTQATCKPVGVLI